MIIVIKEQASSDIITLSCVTSFDESYTGSVSSHPIESGSTITDHVTSDNDKFKVSGVVSDYDFLNPSKDLATKKEGYDDGYLRSAVTASFANGLLNTYGAIVPDKQRAEYIKRRLIDIRKNSLLVTILEYPDSGELVQHTDCILTSLSFKEDENTGYAVYPDMSFEKINVVQVKVEEVDTSKIPKLPDSKVADAAAGISDKGSVDVCMGRTFIKENYKYENRAGRLTITKGIARFYSTTTTASGTEVIDKEIPYPKELPKWSEQCQLVGKEPAIAEKSGLDNNIAAGEVYKEAEIANRAYQAALREKKVTKAIYDRYTKANKAVEDL